MKLIRRANSVFDGIVNAFAVLAGVIVIALMLAVSASATGRTFWDITWLGLIESCQIGILYFTFLGTTWVLRRERHVTMDLITSRLSPRSYLIINIITSILCVFMCLVLVWYSAEVVWHRWLAGVYRYEHFEILDAHILVIIPVGTLLLFIQFLRRIIGFIVKLKGIGKPEANVSVEESKGF